MDNVVVYLHEDVADSSFGGGDDGHDVLRNSVENGDPDPDVDPGVAVPDDVDPDVGDPEPVDLVPASDDDNDDFDADDEYDPDAQPSRKSVRFSRPPKIFTYNEIGGPPVLIDIKK